MTPIVNLRGRQAIVRMDGLLRAVEIVTHLQGAKWLVAGDDLPRRFLNAKGQRRASVELSDLKILGQPALTAPPVDLTLRICVRCRRAFAVEGKASCVVCLEESRARSTRANRRRQRAKREGASSAAPLARRPSLTSTLEKCRREIYLPDRGAIVLSMLGAILREGRR